MPARSTLAHALDRVRRQFAPSLTRLVAVLALVAAPVAAPLAAQTPPVVTVTPAANTHESSAALTITVTACADMSMTSTQSVFVGTAGYTATGSGNMPRGCGRTTAGTWTAHVTLSPGVNNVSAEVCDVASNCGFGSTTIIYDAPPPTYNILVTANTAPITMQELTGGSASFTVANNGPTQGTAHIVVSCTGMSGSCSGSKDTVLAAGASAPITAGFTTGSTPTTGSITVTASYNEAPSVSSSASTSVTIQPRPPSIAVTLDSAAQVTVGPGSRTLFYTVSNTGGVAYDVSISADCGVFGSCTPLINNSLILGTVHFESGASQDVTIPLSVTAAQQGSLNVPVTLTASGPVTGAASYSVSYPAPLYSIAVTANTPPITTHVATGGTANFSVTNNGPTQGTAHIVVSCIGMSGSCSGSKDTVLAAGASAPITAGFTTGSTATTSGSVTVTASYLEASSVSSSASTSVNILPAPASLAVTLDSAAQVTAGPGSETLHYTASNTGTDPVDVSLSADCGVFAGCTPLINGAFIVGTVHLVGGASQPVTVQFTVTAAQQGTLNVSVTLTASGSTAGGPGTGAGSYSVTVPVPPPAFRVIVTASQHAITLTAQQASGIASFFIQDTSTNLGGQQQTYTLTPSCTGVASCAPIPSVTLSQGARVSVDVPYTVAASGTTGRVVLVAASAHTTGSDSETVNTTPFYSLAISPATTSQSIRKGSSGQYPVTVKNSSTNGDVPIDVSLAVTGCGSPALSGCQAPVAFTLAPGASSAQTISYQGALAGVGIIGVTASGTVAAATVLPASAVDSVTVTNPPPQGAIAVAPANDNVNSAAPANLSVTFTISSTDASPDTVAYQISCAGAVTSCHDAAGKTSGKVGPLSQTGTTSALVAVSYHVNSGAGPIGSVTIRAHGVRDSTLTASGTRIVGVNGVPAIVVNTKAAGPGAAIARDQCVAIAAGADAAYECGDLRLAEALPATTTMNKARAPMLVYNSRHASPSALIAANVSVNPGAAVTTLVATVSVRNNSSGAFTSTPAVVFPWTAANNASVSSRIVVPVDFTTLGLGSSLTGNYLYTIQVAAKSGATTVATAADTSSVTVVDRTTSQFGRGWSLDGLEQLVMANVPQTNLVLWVGGDGNARTYTQKSANSAYWFVTPTIDRTDTLQKIGNNWYRHLRNGSYVEFDNMGHQVATQSPGVFGDSTKSRRTVFHYTSGLLDKITLPVASGTAPSYSFTTARDANLNMTTLTIDPPPISGVSRETKVFNNPTTQRDSVIEADGHMVVFGYDTHGRVTTRIDRLQHATTFDYEPTGGTLADSKLTLTTGDPGTVVHAFCAGEAVGLPSLTGTATPCPIGPVDTGSVRTLYDGPRPDVADTTAFHINRFGEPNTIVDALGAVTRIVRDPTFALLADTIVDPAGHVVAATYNNRGLVVTQTSLAPYGVPGQNAVIRNVWNSKFDKPDTTVGPTGESMQYTYNTNGDELTQHDGRGDTTRVTFTYNTNRQPATIRRPGNLSTQLDSLVYDATLGNLAHMTSPLGQITSYQRDAIGRVNMVTTPLSGTLTRQQTSRYDVMDRVMATHDIGPAVPYSVGNVSNTALAMTLSDTNSYDAEGDLLTNIRTSEPDIAFVAPLRLDWTYDDLHRKISGEDAHRRLETWHYDLAGNDTSWTTRQAKTIITHFDALNRQVIRITPGDTVQTQTGALPFGLFPLNTELTKFPYFAPGFTYDPFTNPDATPPDLIIPSDVARFVYDQAGRLDSAINNDARVVRSYFPGGALQTETQQPAVVDTLETPTSDRYAFHTYRFNYTYDLSGRRKTLTSVLPTCASVCNETYTQTYNYGLQSGLLQQITDVGPLTSSVFSFQYDSANRVKSRAASDTGLAAVEGYQYDAAGRLTHRDVTGRAGIPAGGAVYSDDFTYDVANRISVANVTSSLGALVDQSSQFYNGLGALAAIQRERNGERPIDEYAVDAFGNVHAHTLWKDADYMTTVQSFPAGWLTAIADSGTENSQTGQGALLIPSIKPIDTTSNTFDLSGNLIFSTVVVDDTASNAVVPVVAGRGWTWNAYDPGGHLRVTQQSTWGANAQIRTLFIEHRYDALGRQVLVRTRRDLNCIPNAFAGQCLQTVEHYAWDGEQQLAEFRSIVVDTVVTDSGHVCLPDEDPNSCTPRAPSFVYTQTGAGGALESDATAGQLFAGMVRYVFADGIDDPLALWKNDGTTFGLVPHRSWRGMYEAGSTIGPTAVNAQWPGRNRDAYFADDARQTPIEQNQWLGGLVDGKRDQSGLMYMRNRYYDPNSGRFTQEDPIGLAGGMNLYGFAGGDPVNRADPFGLCCDDFSPMERVREESLAKLGGAHPGLAIGAAVTAVAATALLPVAAGAAVAAVADATVTAFFSGVKAAATDWAVANGGRTLGMTAAGKALTEATKDLDYLTEGRPLWAELSRDAASKASGVVHVFLPAAGADPNSIWKTIEEPTLLQNINVTQIITHIVHP